MKQRQPTDETCCVQEAADRHEKEQLDMALKPSLADNAAVAKQRAASRAKLKPRLLQLGLEACETVGDGSCQFLSVCFTAGIPVDPADFRSQCVNYLRHLPTYLPRKSMPSSPALKPTCKT